MDAVRHLMLLVRKELADLRHQRIFLGVGAVAPFLLFMVFYLIWSADITTPIEVVNLAGGRGEAFIEAMLAVRTPSGTPYLRVERRDPAVLRNRPPDKYVAVLELPVDFDVKGVQEHGPVAHYGAVNENTVKNYANRLHEAQSQYLTQNLLGFRPIRVQEEARYSRDVPTRRGMAVGLMAYAFLLSGGIFGGILVTREFESHTMKVIRISPVNRCLLLLSKGLVAMLLTFVAGAIYVVVAAGWLTGAWPAAAGTFLSTAVALSATGVALGTAVGMVLRSSVPVFLVSLVACLTMWIIGGGFASLRLYSQLQQQVAQFFPLTHGLNLFWYSYFGGRPAPPSENAVGIAAIILASVLILAYTARRILERGQ